MKIRFLTIMVAISAVFGVQQAVAKSSSTTEMASKKHHKKHIKQIASSCSQNGRLGV